MNNIEIEKLKSDVKKYLKDSLLAEKVGFLPDNKLHAVKKQIERLKEVNGKSSRDMYLKNNLKGKIIQALGNVKATGPSGLVAQSPIPPKPQPQVQVPQPQNKIKPTKRIKIPSNRKPKILFISDVRGWAWWIKSRYIQSFLSDEYEIDLKCLIGNGCGSNINQKRYDLYFTYGYSYIDHLYAVPRFKKATGVTAHRPRHVILPKMKQAGHVHANSMLLLEELRNMGFKNAYYVPNGVDHELFKQVPVGENNELVVGHVGKVCPAKGQKEIILPAIKKAGAKSFTNMVTWKEKRPHNEMPQIYKNMDVFVVASLEDGTPNPALEAASCGRPIISNRIGNMPEFIKDGWNGFLVDRNIEHYIDKIKYFQQNPDEIIRMGNNARKTIEAEWTWKKQAERYRNMFKHIFEIVD